MHRGLRSGLLVGLWGCSAATEPDGQPGDGIASAPGGAETSTSETSTGSEDPVGTSSSSVAATTGTTDDDDDDDDDAPSFDVGHEGDVPGAGISCDATVAVVPAAPCDATDLTIVAPFDAHYDCLQMSSVPNVPGPLGGMTFALDDPDLLLIGGSANQAGGALYGIRVARDVDCHVIGFAEAAAVRVADAAYNDGGIAYGPDDILFLARWPVNELGQNLPGSAIADSVFPLAMLEVAQSVAGLAFVPSGYPGAGQLKLVSWGGGQWYTLDLAAQQPGTPFLPTSATLETTIGGGPEGFVYVGAENPEVGVVSVLVSEWSAGNVAIYEVDDNGDPILETRRDFVIGLEGAEGAHIDPTSGDFLFATFGGGDRLISITGFSPNPPPAG